jgi:TonB family protein
VTAALPAWLVPWAVQSTVIAMLGLALLRLLKVDEPRVRLRWCQALLPLALLLPWTSAFMAAPSSDVTRIVDNVVLAVAPASFTGSAAAPWWLSTWDLAVVWLGGVLLRTGWLALGLHRLRTWRRSAAPVSDAALEWARVAVPVEAPCLASADTRQPITWGLRRPVVLVPASLAERPAEQRRAVYVHELLHVARGDMRWVWTEEVLRTVLWPLPSVWMLVPALRLAREQVIDGETVQMTRSPRAYVDVLMWCADGTGPRLAPTMPFFRRHQLLTRVASLTREVSMSRLRLMLTSCALVIAVVTGGTFVAAIAPLSPTAQDAAGVDGPGPLERTATLPTLDVPAPRRTYSVEPEWPAAARAENRSSGFRMHLVVGADGSVAEARVVAPMTYTGTNHPVDAAGAALRRAALEAVRQWHFDPPAVAPMLIVTTVRVGEAPPPPATQGDEPVRVGGVVSPPRKIYDVPPVYPQVALDAKVQGVVIVEATLERTGDVSAVRVLRSIPLLDGAALDAVRQWKYEPQPHRLQMTMTINFTLAADNPQP